ncbi:CMP-N-acetylneuraminate-beta-galactosamide-alpha-2,3-sialyltransferase 1-like [Anarhichas minor]|uniref:CMP-N-acetylneuraminate-beta-galactosamide- alpha-2,3-sialyltransferase 1-like n=1 Tax=Anarhichas minor TaxID=65739 RepID=UPI003F739C27
MKLKGSILIFLLGVTGIGLFWRADILSYFTLLAKRPCACDRCLSEGDSLFEQRFSKFDEPFLSVNYNLSEDNFNWWKSLQGRGQILSAYRETVERLFQLVPASAHVEASSPNRCRTCAVVGNSGNLMKSHYGPLIDFQDVVIRINRGQTKGYEADVGNKTTHRVMYPESAADLDNTTRLVLFPFKIKDLDWVTNVFSTGPSGRKSNFKFNKDLVMILNPAFMRYVHDVWLQKKGFYPSTGFMTVVLALHICDEVHVFGFGADSDGNWSHYWTKLMNKNLKTGPHPGGEEYKMIVELAKHQILKFYTGW